MPGVLDGAPWLGLSACGGDLDSIGDDDLQACGGDMAQFTASWFPISM